MENRKYPIGGYAPGNYRCTCCKCGTEFSGDKRAVECEPCAVEAKEAFDALSPEQQQATLERNVIIANWMFETPLTPERDLILRIVSQWGNAVEMPNMDQWLKDYAAKAQPGPRWVKASTPGIKDGHYVAKYKPDDIQFAYDPVGMAFVDADRIHFVCPSLCDIEWAKGHEELKYLQLLDEQPAAGIKQINREWLCGILIEFTIAYVKSTNKDIANDAAEYIYDKLKDVGIEYVLSESEQPAAGREEDLKAEIERRTKLLEDDLKRDCRLNMPGISEQEQEVTWQAYKKRHNL